MIVRLTILTALEVLALVGALVRYVGEIASTLEKIGGKGDSYLAKIAFGVSAIEKETEHLGPQVSQLNSRLVEIGGKLGVVNSHLERTAQALTAGKEGSA